MGEEIRRLGLFRSYHDWLEWAAQVKAGDRIEVNMRGKWVPTTVLIRAPSSELDWWVRVRKDGKDKLGRKLGSFLMTARDARYARPVRGLPDDAPTAFAFSDWLEEKGQPEAARLLREAFPGH